MHWTLISARRLAIAGLLLLLLYAFGTLLDGLARTFLSSPIGIVRDMAQPYIAMALSCCFPYGFVIRSNIVVTLLDPLLPAGASRGLAAFGWLVTLIIVGCFAYQFFQYARELQSAGETTAMYAVPTAPFWYLVALNFAFGAIVHLFTFKEWMASSGTEAGEHP
ncbi:MAG TPA: TRAP transporter small permease subunit [Devosiaceae bacterium]|jgi:TRAP-type C4-dicarboxylate transport system permease small subunit